ncbi:MAG: YtxH domain-containing protein [Anaerolineales bacterium]|nr:YtxH domain-containing protein [Anaerolineales bacterium]
MNNEIEETEEYKNTSTNPLKVLAGILIGGLAGAVAMLLLAPKSGKDTRIQIQNKSIELVDRAAGFVDDTISQVHSITNEIANGGRQKFEEIKQHGQDLAVEQLDHLTKAAKASKKAIRKS